MDFKLDFVYAVLRVFEVVSIEFCESPEEMNILTSFSHWN